MSSAYAAWATKAVRPTHLTQGIFTHGFRSIEFLEFVNGESLQELNGVAPHDLSGICFLLYGIAIPVAKLVT
jgi:hypothetical protein